METSRFMSQIALLSVFSYFLINFGELLKFDIAIVYLLEKQLKSWNVLALSERQMQQKNHSKTLIGFVHVVHCVIRNSKLAADNQAVFEKLKNATSQPAYEPSHLALFNNK